MKKMPKNDTKKFLISATILFGITIFASQAIFFHFFETKNFPFRITCIGMIWLATCTSYLWVMKTVTEKPKAFNKVFMVQTAAKLLLYLMCITGYLFFYKEHGIYFTLHFFVVYIIFATFEVSLILKFVKKAKT